MAGITGYGATIYVGESVIECDKVEYVKQEETGLWQVTYSLRLCCRNKADKIGDACVRQLARLAKKWVQK